LTAAGLTVIVVEIFAMVSMKIALSAPVILISLVALFGASSAHADVYMYQDKDGVRTSACVLSAFTQCRESAANESTD
jgi:hypothetical protein